MTADKGKRSKIAEQEGEDAADHIDGELVLSIEKLQEVQDELEKTHISSFHKHMADNASDNRYKPGPDFDEDNRVPILPISLSDSTELWLIQWPTNQLQPADLHGKKLSLKLHRDGKLASFKNSSGKSHELVSFSAQEPDATVFLPSSSDLKIVGKISRRVCLVHYPEPGEFDKPSFINHNLSGLRVEGSRMKTLSHLPAMHNMHGKLPGTDRSSRETLTSLRSIGEKSKKRKMKAEE